MNDDKRLSELLDIMNELSEKKKKDVVDYASFKAWRQGFGKFNARVIRGAWLAFVAEFQK